MAVGTIRPIALSHLSQACLSLVISRRCHSALYWRSKRNFLPEVSHGLSRSRASPVAALEVQALRGTASERITKVYLDSTRSRFFFNGTGPWGAVHALGTRAMGPQGRASWCCKAPPAQSARRARAGRGETACGDRTHH